MTTSQVTVERTKRQLLFANRFQCTTWQRKSFEGKLTEIHGNRTGLLDQVNQSVAFKIFDNISTRVLLRKQPWEDLFFFIKISWKQYIIREDLWEKCVVADYGCWEWNWFMFCVTHTGVYHWFLGRWLKEDNGWQGKHSQLLGHLFVIDLDKVNAGLICLIIDVFNLGQNTGTLLAIIAV